MKNGGTGQPRKKKNRATGSSDRGAAMFISRAAGCTGRFAQAGAAPATANTSHVSGLSLGRGVILKSTEEAPEGRGRPVVTEEEGERECRGCRRLPDYFIGVVPQYPHDARQVA